MTATLVKRQAGPRAAGAARGRRGRRRAWLVAVFFVLPALLLLGALVVYPVLFSVGRSFFDASGTRFVGGDNYTEMFRDPATLKAIRNTAIWVVVAPALLTGLGLILAVLVEKIRWATAFKLLLFMPMAVSFLAAGIIFRLAYDQDPDKGVLNAAVVSVHDAFTGTSTYPTARGRQGLLVHDRDGSYRTTGSTGDTVNLAMVGVLPKDLPKGAAPAYPAATAKPAPGQLGGVVYLDFTPGGGGEQGRVDRGESGLPGMKVEAVRGGKTVASTTTAPDGSFRFTGLADGSYTVKLPASNFAPPYQGVSWLGPALVTPAIIGAYLWIWTGFAMVLISAGLSTLPRDALEAARIDGANEWQIFRRITVPLLAPVLTVVFVTLVINVMKVFDLVYIIAPGPVQEDATVLATQMWLVSFGGGNNQGLGSALGVLLLLLVVPAMVFNVRRFRRSQR
ncbi:ABC transporter permease [Streptomyces pluripotens]|uniref:ABC transporter permease n=1 Tax=Streptomyces pluripotens TaxID=1355015 RepID=A0A221NV93_9ACTN|nr:MULTISPECIES: ABC transporter permease subunit [Streptomyces]ARP69667.1 ABC transporter permease [Streptomyces pluripotens]ASN23923.1 ABC transporter permease [Streptomyces pluripotens]KIE24590.1 ABC transporter permease [Streptomyces sp. MUSC 125]MCH0558573.1 ABC transporter permease subunit [Streptomyces sp. MUM 16J]